MSEILSVIQTVARPRPEIGQIGEALATEYLEQNGYRLVLSNFKVPIGRNSKGVQVTGEIDVIALERDVLCFVEVKTKRSAVFAAPIATVDLRKQRQITRTARVYRKIFGLHDSKYRFDVVSIILEMSESKIELSKGFWIEAKFRKKAWTGDIW